MESRVCRRPQLQTCAYRKATGALGNDRQGREEGAASHRQPSRVDSYWPSRLAVRSNGFAQ
eukprot:2429726-Pleurochrysis_carterae.AAC.1